MRPPSLILLSLILLRQGYGGQGSYGGHPPSLILLRLGYGGRGRGGGEPLVVSKQALTLSGQGKQEADLQIWKAVHKYVDVEM